MGKELSICFGSSCVHARKLDGLFVSPKRVDVEERERLCGYVPFRGKTSPSKFVIGLDYVFDPEDGLKEIRVYARENQIAVDLVQ